MTVVVVVEAVVAGMVGVTEFGSAAMAQGMKGKRGAWAIASSGSEESGQRRQIGLWHFEG